MEVEQLFSFHHRVIILPVVYVIICWQSKFAYKFGLIYAIFDVNFEQSGLGVFIKSGVRGLDNNDRVIRQVSLYLLKPIKIIGFISQLGDNLKGCLWFLILFIYWNDHYSLEGEWIIILQLVC